MTIKATKFNPEVLLSAPRRSAGVPNADGSKIIYSTSTYSFTDHKANKEFRILDAKTNQSSLLTSAPGASDLSWFDDTSVIGFAPAGDEEGATKILIGDSSSYSTSTYSAGVINGEIDGPIIKKLGDGKYILAFAANAKPDGSLYNAAKAKKAHATGRVYKQLFVRHWDEYKTKEQPSIFYGILSTNGSVSSTGKRYTFSGLTNALKGTGLVSPIFQSTGSGVNWDIGPHGLVFVAKDPSINKALYVKQNLYVMQVDHTQKDFTLKEPMFIKLSGFEGATCSPVLSPDGRTVAFLSSRDIQNEADKLQLWIMPDIQRPTYLHYMYSNNHDYAGRWDMSPDTIVWGTDSRTLFLGASDSGQYSLYVIKASDTANPNSLPSQIRFGPAVGDIRVLENGDVFISGSNYVDSSVYSRLSHDQVLWCMNSTDTLTTTKTQWEIVSSLLKNGSTVGLNRDQISSFYYPGAKVNIHAWVIKPSDFDPKKKYPLAYYVHGGPQGAWSDAWSTRWNPAVIAEQGYVVIAPNPTGSTGYGQRLTDDILKNFGGLPYIDLVKGMEYIENNLDYVDMDRAVALGASYGGYMMNYFQGMPIASKFRALVTHDGIFSTVNHLSTEELWFPFKDVGGPYWDSDPPAQKTNASMTSQVWSDTSSVFNPSDLDISGASPWHHWDPAHPLRLARGWKTPHLIIHSDKDYRLPITEGLAAFNVLQVKGTKSKFLNFPDENHWVLKPENSLLWHKVVIDWINEAVGLPAWKNDVAEELLKDAEMD